MNDDDLFDGPGSADQFKPADYEGRLLLVKALQTLTGINTANGPKDAVEADIHVLDGDQAGTVLRGAYLFPLVLQGQVRANIGRRPNLGRLGKGTAKPGQNPPWKLLDPTDADKALATRYIKAGRYDAAPAPAADPAPAAAAPAADPWDTNSSDAPF